MIETNYTPGPWAVVTKSAHVGDWEEIEAADGRSVCVVRTCYPDFAREDANNRLIAASPDRHEQMVALTQLGWTVRQVLALDSDRTVKGWCWREPDGTSHEEVGDWDDLPPWPDSAREAVAAALALGFRKTGVAANKEGGGS